MRKTPRWLKGIIFLCVSYLIFFFRLPFYLEVPGSIFSLDEMVEVENTEVDASGDFYITTVGIQQVTLATIGRSLFPYQDLVSQAELFGDFDNLDSYNQLQKYHMETSVNHAVKAAFDAAGENYEFKYNGVYVLQISKESDFLDKLEIGDIIQAVDGNYFKSSTEFMDYIANQEVPANVNLEVERNNQLIHLDGQLIKLENGKTGIGIGLVDNTQITTNPTVHIESGAIGGPSAGLMFALELYMQLIGQNIRDDYDIAGTGTIDPDGNVGRIGGIEKKVLAASREDIDYFFAPADELTDEYKAINPQAKSNYAVAVDTVEDIESDMIIVPVKTIMDAIHYLEQLSSKEVVQKNREVINLHQPEVCDDLLPA